MLSGRSCYALLFLFFSLAVPSSLVALSVLLSRIQRLIHHGIPIFDVCFPREALAKASLAELSASFWYVLRCVASWSCGVADDDVLSFFSPCLLLAGPSWQGMRLGTRSSELPAPSGGMSGTRSAHKAGGGGAGGEGAKGLGPKKKNHCWVHPAFAPPRHFPATGVPAQRTTRRGLAAGSQSEFFFCLVVFGPYRFFIPSDIPPHNHRPRPPYVDSGHEPPLTTHRAFRSIRSNGDAAARNWLSAGLVFPRPQQTVDILPRGIQPARATRSFFSQVYSRLQQSFRRYHLRADRRAGCCTSRPTNCPVLPR